MRRKPAPTIRNRIKGLRQVRAGDLVPNPRNWRKHPTAQREALRGVLREIGYASALLARELPDGRLEVVDGHLRQDLDPDQTVPVLVLDLDAAEAAKLMTLLDPVGAMAEADKAALGSLLEEIETESEALQAMLAEMAADAGLTEPAAAVAPLEIRPPPTMAWLLIGIPAERFEEVTKHLQPLLLVAGLSLDTVWNDGGRPNFRKR